MMMGLLQSDQGDHHPLSERIIFRCIIFVDELSTTTHSKCIYIFCKVINKNSSPTNASFFCYHRSQCYVVSLDHCFWWPCLDPSSFWQFLRIQLCKLGGIQPGQFLRIQNWSKQGHNGLVLDGPCCSHFRIAPMPDIMTFVVVSILSNAENQR